MKKEIGIVDIGYGNIGSVYNAVQFLGLEPSLEKKSENLKKYSHLILPGVGSFAKNSEIIHRNGWFEPLKDFIKNGSYIFGICIGMQMMFEGGTEGGNNKGLGIFSGFCKKFETDLIIPHVGFNTVEHKNTKIWNDIPNNSSFYFVHSYRIENTSENINYCHTVYGEKFISFIEKENVFGSQFHPEKSHNPGLKLLQNFLNLK